jgi:hypothetical protein
MSKSILSISLYGFLHGAEYLVVGGGCAASGVIRQTRDGEYDPVINHEDGYEESATMREEKDQIGRRT